MDFIKISQRTKNKISANFYLHVPVKRLFPIKKSRKFPFMPAHAVFQLKFL
jgi:hypothetical protein